MSIKKYYASVCKSCLYTLTLDGKIVGMRAKVFDKGTNDFSYNDFSTSLIKDKEVQNFLRENKAKFTALHLVENVSTVDNGDGTKTVTTVMVTEEEIKSQLQVKEFKTAEEAESILKEIINIYKVKG